MSQGCENFAPGQGFHVPAANALKPRKACGPRGFFIGFFRRRPDLEKQGKEERKRTI